MILQIISYALWAVVIAAGIVAAINTVRDG